MKPLVAVLDDEESVRKALHRLFRSAGLDVDTYGSGLEFFAASSARDYDCLVLDLHMPVLNGFEVQARLNSETARVPVVVITGHDTDEARQRVLDAGASSYLRKPVDDQTLLDAVAGAIAGRVKVE